MSYDVQSVESRTVAQIVESTDDLSSLEYVLQQSALLDVLGKPGAFTLFAPDDAAFASAGTSLSSLLQPANAAELRRLLRHHIVDGLVRSTMLSTGQQLRTLEGSLLPIQMEPRPMIHGTAAGHMANILNMDLPASNGVLHKIDAVLLPPDNSAAVPLGATVPSLRETLDGHNYIGRNYKGPQPPQNTRRP